jgi:hypothetical protein
LGTLYKATRRRACRCIRLAPSVRDCGSVGGPLEQLNVGRWLGLPTLQAEETETKVEACRFYAVARTRRGCIWRRTMFSVRNVGPDARADTFVSRRLTAEMDFRTLWRLSGVIFSTDCMFLIPHRFVVPRTRIRSGSCATGCEFFRHDDLSRSCAPSTRADLHRGGGHPPTTHPAGGAGVAGISCTSYPSFFSCVTSCLRRFSVIASTAGPCSM